MKYLSINLTKYVQSYMRIQSLLTSSTSTTLFLTQYIDSSPGHYKRFLNGLPASMTHPFFSSL